MTCNLNLFHQYSTKPFRNINKVIILFSLTNDLNIKINGEVKDLDAHIAIINHGDIFEVENAHNIVQLTIPIFYFYVEDDDFSSAISIDIYYNLVVISKRLFYKLYNNIQRTKRLIINFVPK